MAEISAEQCQKDPQCVNVKVNVIYDRNANGGDGLTAKQKAKFEKSLLANAKDEYGNSKVRLDVSYAAGGVENGKIEGAVKGAVNVIVSDGSVTLGPGFSQENSGYALTALNINRADGSTLSHELTHHFMGDTVGILNSISRADPTGIFNFGANALTDLRNDQERSRIGMVGPYFGNRFDPPPGQPMPLMRFQRLSESRPVSS